jgi:hypothetical protein
MKRQFACAVLAVAVVLGVARVAQAHHSRAPFDLDKKIELDATITEVAWRSPHVYYEATVRNAAGVDETWTFEGHSIPGFLRLGWQRDTIEVGDRVAIVAHPNRAGATTFAMLYSVTRADGNTYYAYQIPQGQTVPGLQAAAPVAPSTDFSGTWRHMIPVLEAAIGSFRPPTEWPLTPKGRAQVDAWNLNDDPELDCVPLGVPRLILATYSHRWRREAGNIVIVKERSNQTRVIHLDGAPRPPDYVPNELGYSVGRFEADGTLVIETDGFAPTRWGNSRGLDSSAVKRVVERYELAADGLRMSVSYTIEDPEFLTEPVTVTGEYQKGADYEFVAETCDPATARKHLQFQGAVRSQPSIEFVAATPAHERAVRDYRAIWDQDGARIVAALEARTCLKFAEPKVSALVDDATSNSGGPQHAMGLRASYDLDVKRATLVHELAHRHLWQLTQRLDDLDGHRTLYLVLDRVWADVWGEQFAAERVRTESSWHAEYDYAAAWSWASALSIDERSALWNRLLAMNGRPYCHALIIDSASTPTIASRTE